MLISMSFLVVCLFLLSVFIHIGSIFHFYHVSKALMIFVGYFSFLLMVYPLGYSMKNLTGDLNNEEYKRFQLSICPRWMTITGGLLIMYALASIAYHFINRQLMHFTADNQIYVWDAKCRTFSSVAMALHFLAFTMLYGCRYIKKDRYPEIDTE